MRAVGDQRVVAEAGVLAEIRNHQHAIGGDGVGADRGADVGLRHGQADPGQEALLHIPEDRYECDRSIEGVAGKRGEPIQRRQGRQSIELHGTEDRAAFVAL